MAGVTARPDEPEAGRLTALTGYYNLGDHGRTVTTNSANAQLWFDRGLNWTFGFNQDEAIRCFERAIGHDPECAMAHWGLAYAHGPYVNKDWRFYGADELNIVLPIMHNEAHRAVDLASDATPAEQMLCQALTERYPTEVAPQIDVMVDWHSDFAMGMRHVHERFPDDLDVIAIYVEAMMMRTPWRLWDLDTGAPADGADTLAMLDVLNHGLKVDAARDGPPHPGIAHMMIHTVEMSSTPELGADSADALRGFAPDIGHLIHMPSHIDVLCGRYLQAVRASEAAVAADRIYLAQVGPFGQYTAAICHDNHLLMFASMLMGRWGSAIRAADMICDIVTDEVLIQSTPAFQITLEAYLSMRMHVFVRFGKWNEILLDVPPSDRDLYPVSTAMHHYAVGIARASLGDHGGAAAERAMFDAIVRGIAPERHLFNNTAHTVLAVAGEMLAGETAYHRGEHDLGFDHLRCAVQLNDGLEYTEPWAWMHPPRHALGALLLAEGHVEEAEMIYRADLGLDGTVQRSNVHPDNVWCLHGLVECLERRGARSEAADWRVKLDAASILADSPITSSCACRTIDTSEPV